MTIPFFILVIEKTDELYLGYTPNLVGISATGRSREEVEKSLLSQVSSHIEELNNQYAIGRHKLQLSTQPLEQKIGCLAIIGEDHSFAWSCKMPARKEGLCWQHWAQRFGHAAIGPAGSRSCQLCDERIPDVNGWALPCNVKSTDPDWPNILNRKRQSALEAKRIAAQEDRRRKRFAALPIQCAAIKTQGPKGVRCSNLAQRDGLCTNHWKTQNS
jgi:hypothetical protein